MLYQIRQGVKFFGTTEVFRNCQFEIKGNEKIAIVGRNGSGKSTLLKIIAGDVTLDSGEIHKISQLRLGVLSQMAFSDESMTVQQAFEEAFATLKQLESSLHSLQSEVAENPTDQNLESLANMLHRFEDLGGYTYESEMNTVLTKMGFHQDDLSRTLSTFSGGQKTRLAFAKLLLSKPDILLLDEPTNHLDMSTIEWLEGYLAYYPKALVFVSHDRYFLDKVANVIVDIDDYKTTRYTGNYSSFVHRKQLDIQKNEVAFRRQQKEIERLEALIEKFRYKKSKAAFAQSKIKYLDRMEKVDAPKKEGRSFSAEFSSKIRGAKEVLVMDQLNIGYEKPLATLSATFYRGSKIAVVGDNGTGKSTLLKTIVGAVAPLGGEMLLGHQIEIGYFDQDLAQFDSNKTVLEELWDEFPQLDKTEVRTVLGRFLFSNEDVFKSVSVLSGGEKVRLSLAKLMLKRSNFLVLDEPTNHLDLLGKEALEESLLHYDGTLLFVSHDRYFIEKLANAKLIFKDQSVTYDVLNIEDLTSTSSRDEVKEEKKIQRMDAQRERKQAQREMVKVEKLITESEEALEQLRELRFDPEYYHDFQKMKQLDDRIDDAVNLVAKYMLRWEELHELLEGE